LNKQFVQKFMEIMVFMEKYDVFSMFLGVKNRFWGSLFSILYCRNNGFSMF